MVSDLINAFGRVGGFGVRAFRHALSPPFFWRETVEQMDSLGFRCLIPVVAVLAPLGAVVSLQGLLILRIFGAEPLISSLIAASVFRELSPGIASLMVAAQAGSSMAAELGTMRVKDEIDAQEVMAVNPFKYLIVPRIIAGTLMTPVLNVVGVATGVFGGYVIAVQMRGVSHGVFMSNLYNFLRPADLVQGIVKAGVFGFIISLLSCYHGFHASGGAAGVGRAANCSVVRSILCILVANYVLTSAFLGTT
ncbi:MAG: ABC transporter permease [Planctomycetota bacterium]